MGPQEQAGVAGIHAPVFGFYGGNDARIGASIPKTAELMKADGKKYEPVTYEGAGHGFMRAGAADDARPADKKAHDEGWARWLGLLGKL
jgi:carboxymethylenebutenolidase